MQLDYSIANDTLNGEASASKLEDEIRDSSIVVALDSVLVINSTDLLRITFKATLSTADQTTLDGIVAAHDGVPSVDDPQKFILVDEDENPLSLIQDGSVYKIGIDFGESTIVGPEGPQGPQGAQGPQGPPGAVSVFGSQYNYEESLTESQTTSTTPVNKLSATINSLPSGQYRINWSFAWAAENTSREFFFEIEQDNSRIYFLNERPKASGVGSDDFEFSSGFLADLTLNGNHTFDLNFWTDANWATVAIKEVRFELWRVS